MSRWNVGPGFCSLDFHGPVREGPGPMVRARGHLDWDTVRRCGALAGSRMGPPGVSLRPGLKVGPSELEGWSFKLEVSEVATRLVGARGPLREGLGPMVSGSVQRHAATQDWQGGSWGTQLRILLERNKVLRAKSPP